MRLACSFIVGLLAILGLFLKPAAADTLLEKAELWGALHGAAIYCRQRDTDAFGTAAMAYFKRRAASAAEYKKLNDTYGLTVIHTARIPPSRAAGASCSGFSEKYRTVWKLLRGG